MRTRTLLLVALCAAGPAVAEHVATPKAKPAPAPVAASLRDLLHLPDGIAAPRIPAFNPLTPGKIALGRQLFYDTNLSANQTQSCASCHIPALAFTDGLPTATGSTGAVHFRNSQSLVNLGWVPHLTWSSHALTTLEEQIHIPLRSDRPVEMGVNDGNAAGVLARFTNDPDYTNLYRAAFPDSPTGPTWNKTVHALASFVRTMTSFSSPVDAYQAGDTTALSPSAIRGLALFNSERLECFHCHSGPTLTTSYIDASTEPGSEPFMFFSNGLYNVGNTGTYPAHDQGLFELTGNPRHRGLFRSPTLRNIALTAPYMHDGSIETLEGVIDHYAAGGRKTLTGPYAGDGRLNPNKSPFIVGFTLTDQERADLVTFLEALTDEEFTDRPDLQPPSSRAPE